MDMQLKGYTNMRFSIAYLLLLLLEDLLDLLRLDLLLTLERLRPDRRLRLRVRRPFTTGVLRRLPEVMAFEAAVLLFFAMPV